MSEGAPEYRATEGPAVTAGAEQLTALDAIDDAYGHAYDALLEAAREVRQHVCLDPPHVDVSPDFLDAAAEFAIAVDAFEVAELAVEQAAEAARVAVEPRTGEPDAPGQIIVLGGDEERWLLWCAAFHAGAAAQHKEITEFAQRRGWVSVSSAVLTIPLAQPPAREAVGEILYASFIRPSTTDGGSDVRP